MNQQKLDKITHAATSFKKQGGIEPNPTKMEDIHNPLEEEKKIPESKVPEVEAMKIEQEEIKKPEVIDFPENKTEAQVKPKPKLQNKKKPEDKSKSNITPKEIKEEDVGPIMEEAEADAQITQILQKDIVDDLSNPAWKERQKALQNLNQWIITNAQQETKVVEALIIFLKKRLKDFKESNIGVMKEAFIVLETITGNFAVTKKFAFCTVPALVDRMADVKQIDPCINILLSISDSATPTYVSTLAIKNSYVAKSINVIKGVLSLLGKMIEGYTVNLMPMKITIDFAKFCLCHSNPQVRTSATSYIKIAYASVGDMLKQMLSSDLKDATYKAVEAELTKIQPNTGKAEIVRKLKGDSEQEAQKKKGKDLSDSLMPRVNIAGQITSNLISKLADNSMKHRQEAKDAIEKILAAANNRIQPTGLNALMGALKGRMNEPCKNLGKAFITLVGNLALAMGSGCKQYSKIILKPLMFNLSDKQSAIRAETVIAMDKFAEASGAETVINCLPALLEKDNPEMRSETLTWIIKNKESLGKSDSRSLVNSLVSAMQDRSKEIRARAEEVIAEVMPHAGFPSFSCAIQDLKPIVKASLAAILEKYKTVEISQSAIVPEIKKEQDVVMNVKEQQHPIEDSKEKEEKKVENKKEEEKMDDVKDQPEVEQNKDIEQEKAEEAFPENIVKEKEQVKIPVEEAPIPVPKLKEEKKLVSPQKQLPKPQHVTKEPEAKNIKEEKKAPANKRKDSQKIQESIISSRSTADLEKEQNASNTILRMQSKKDILEVKKRSSLKTANGKTIAKSPSKSQLSNTSTFGTLNLQCVVYKTLGNKDKRAEEDKSVKWPVNEIQQPLVEKLRKKLNMAIDPNLLDYMFATNFKKNLEAVTILNDHLKSEFTSMYDIMDLIFKWLTIKMVDLSNTAINKSIMELLRNFFTELANSQFLLKDFEAAAILPMLCERTSIGNASLREEVKELIQQSCSIYSNTKVAGFLVKALESKNPKTRNECLALLKDFLTKYGPKVVQGKDIKPIAKMLANADNATKQEISDILAEIYKSKGENIWSLTGPLNDANKEMLKQRFSEISQGDPPEEEDKESTPTNGEAIINETSNITLSMQKISLSKQSNQPEEHDEVHEESKNTPGSNAKPKGEPMPMSDILINEEQKIDLSSKHTQDMEAFGEDEKTIINLVTEMDCSPIKVNDRKQDGETLKIDTLEQCLEMLKNKDISKRVDALVCLNEKTSSLLDQNKGVLAANCNLMFTTFSEVLKEAFERPEHDIPLRFTKFFLGAVNKVCGIKTVVKDANEQSIRPLLEQLLSKLLYDGLDKLGVNKEGEFIIKTINSAVIKMLENCNPTRVLIALIRLFGQYKIVTANSGKVNLVKMPSIIAKCLQKLTKVFDSLVPNLDIGLILLCIYEHLTSNISNNQPKTPADDMGLRLGKTLLNELVKAKREDIWKEYKIIEQLGKPDEHIKKWITLVLKSFSSGGSQNGNPEKEVQQSSFNPLTKETSEELKEIFKDLNSQATMQKAIQRLSEYIAKHPTFDLKQYFGSCSNAFSEFVISSLQQYTMQINSDPGESQKQKPSEAKAPGSVAEYRARMNLLKKTLGVSTTKEETQSITYQTQQHFGQASSSGSSTSEIFNKISQYKANLNKKP